MELENEDDDLDLDLMAPVMLVKQNSKIVTKK